MVELVENWTTIKEYAGNKQGFYQIIEDQTSTEIRVHVSRLGFKKQFDNKDDPLLKSILEFCKSKKFIPVISNIMDQYFFEHIPEEKNKKN